MKTLKFRPHLAEKILLGEKTSTWRLFDDKDLREGDVLELLNKETLEPFAQAKITKVCNKKLGELTDADWEGHERFASDEEMYRTFNTYYEPEVTPETEMNIVSFSLA